MKRLLLLISLVIPNFIATSTYAQENPIVLELFTSQSCSSCPPADRLLGKINAENPNVIALSCHVTYWNYLHWQDTLSREFCNDRQRQYVRSLNARGSYTPQVVINGKHELVGSREGQIRRLIDKELAAKNVKPLNLNLSKDKLVIDLSAVHLAEEHDYTITILSYGNTHHQNIKSGENRGRAVTYTNPVKSITTQIYSGEHRIIKNLEKREDVASYAVLLHKGGTTAPIIAAGKLSL